MLAEEVNYVVGVIRIAISTCSRLSPLEPARCRATVGAFERTRVRGGAAFRAG